MIAAPKRADVERFREVVGRHLGLHFDDGKLELLGDVLRKRLEAAHPAEVASYLDALGMAPAELRVVAQHLTVPETYFFRNADHLRAFVEVVVRGCVRARAAQRHLRILSAGCASGEEAYTIGMLLRDHFPELESWKLELHGVDINVEVLAKAKRACFSAWSLRQTPDAQRERWFKPVGHDYELLPSIRGMTTFEERNLIEDDPSFWRPGSFDIVFCRNVIMYFSPEAARQVIARITRALQPEGYLFLGHAETLRGLSTDFHLRHTHDTFYYQLRGEGDVAAVPDRAAPSRLPISSPSPQFAPADVSWFGAIHRGSERIAKLAERPQARAAEQPAVAAQPAAVRDRIDLTGAADLLRQERYVEALQALQGLPTQDGADPDALLLRAALLTSSGNVIEAARVCAQLLALDELNAGAHYIMALCSEHGGDARAAAEHDGMAIYLDPDFAMPHLHLGHLARRAGDVAAARREFKTAVRLLDREDASRILLFGGGFRREALVSLCQAHLGAGGGMP